MGSYVIDECVNALESSVEPPDKALFFIFAWSDLQLGGFFNVFHALNQRFLKLIPLLSDHLCLLLLFSRDSLQIFLLAFRCFNYQPQFGRCVSYASLIKLLLVHVALILKQLFPPLEFQINLLCLS